MYEWLCKRIAIYIVVLVHTAFLSAILNVNCKSQQLINIHASPYISLIYAKKYFKNVCLTSNPKWK